MTSQTLKDVVASTEMRNHLSADPHRAHHQVEHDVCRHLRSEPSLKFSSLVVRRVPNGLCLQGVLEAEEGSPDVSSLVRKVANVEKVINQLVMMPTSR